MTHPPLVWDCPPSKGWQNACAGADASKGFGIAPRPRDGKISRRKNA